MKRKIINNWSLVAVLLAALLVSWPLFVPGYFSHHDDLQVMRIFEMRKCFSDLQIPCRWVPDMGFGYGFPMFNYYAPLAYYLGGLVSYLLGYVLSAKLIFLLPLVLGGVSMYFLGKGLFGKWGGIISAILYTYLPYRALDIYVRGAVAESFAIAIIPLVLYFSLNLVKKRNSLNFLALAISFAAFMISHNIMVLIFFPFVVIWEIINTFFRDLKVTLVTLVGYIFGLGLASFFLIPAFFERNIINTSGLTSFELDFRANFLAVRQLFERSWGYVLQNPDIANSMSFQLGWPHILLAFLALIVLLFSLYPGLSDKLKVLKSSTGKQTEILVVFFGLSLAISLFMTHNKSTPIWELIDILKYVQFPWRFLSVAGFFVALLGGYVVSMFKEPFDKYIAVVVIISSILLNFGYFKPEKFYITSDAEKLSGVEFEVQQKGAILDYLPKGVREPKELAFSLPRFTVGEGEVKDFTKGSSSWEFTVESSSEATLEVPVFDYPNWMIKVDDNKQEHARTEWGTVTITVPSGNHLVTGNLVNTPLRTISNMVSLVSLILLLTVIKYGKNIKLFN